MRKYPLTDSHIFHSTLKQLFSRQMQICQLASLYLLEKIQCIPTLQGGITCEFLATYAYTETSIIVRLKLSILFHCIFIADVIKAIYRG